MHGDFVFVDELVPGVRWDAKYATWDNFTGLLLTAVFFPMSLHRYQRLSR